MPDQNTNPALPTDYGTRRALAYNGQHVGVFATEDDAETVLRLLMDRDKFYPNTWELRVIS